MKPNSTWEETCWLVVGGSWLVTLFMKTHEVVGKPHNIYGFLIPTSIALERQVTKKEHMSHAKVGASFCLSYL